MFSELIEVYIARTHGVLMRKVTEAFNYIDIICESNSVKRHYER